MTQKPSEFFASSPRRTNKSSTHMVSIRLPEDLLRRLADVGNEQGLSMSDTIRLVLERGLTQKGAKRP